MIEIYEQFINHESKQMGSAFMVTRATSVEEQKKYTTKNYNDIKVVYEVPNVLCVLVADESNEDEHKIITIKEILGNDYKLVDNEAGEE